MCSESLPRSEVVVEKTESLLEEIVIGQELANLDDRPNLGRTRFTSWES
jgi:hypothetical protein